MSFVVVPNTLRDAIYRAIDNALEAVPEAAPDREHFFEELLRHYHEHGEIPDFTLVKR